MFMELILVGNVGRDPELRYTNNGTAVCDFSLAVNRKSKNADGERIEETTWFRVTVWGAQAEIVNQYVQKGKSVLVVADRIEANAYMSRNNEPRASLDITARDVRFLGGNDGDRLGEPASTPDSDLDGWFAGEPATNNTRRRPSNDTPF